MLKANQKVRVINDTPFISKGTVVRIEENKETKEIETGKTGIDTEGHAFLHLEHPSQSDRGEVARVAQIFV